MKFFLLILCSLSFSQVLASSLIFVHLGNSIPSCLFTTMKQARYLNPDLDMYLLADEMACKTFESECQDLLQEDRIDLINMQKIPKSREYREFYEFNKLSASFAESYWMYASERFFALYDFIRERQLKDVLHLENDCMLYVEVSEILPLFSQRNVHLAAPFQSLKGCIPCFVFIKDASSLAPLIAHIISEMKSFQGIKSHLCVNDMQTLASFYEKFGASSFLPLPTLMPEYSRNYPKRRSSFAPDNATPLSFLSLYADQFPEYLFDAAGLGIFINGNDRKYSPTHGPGTVHARSLFDPHFFSFFWGINEKGQNVPYLSFKGKNYKIVNLHFHSKMPQDYASFSDSLGELPCRRGI